MDRILRIFGKEYSNINQAAFLLGFFAFLSQILALFRDRSFAHFIGPSPALDAYYAAFRVPDLIFICIASLASITVLIPFFTAKMKTGTITDEAKKYLNDIFTVFLIVIIFVSLIAFFLMPFLAPFITPIFEIYGLALGVVLGAFTHFGIQALATKTCGFSLKFSSSINWADIKAVALTSLPRTLGLALNNIALIAIIAFASYLQAGSISRSEE